MDAPRLPEAAAARLAEVGAADLVVAVLSYQHARTIAGVIRAVDKAVRGRFPEARALILHSDAGSTDGTREAAEGAASDLPLVALAHPVSAAERAAPPPHGVPGAAAAFRTLCLVARTAGARAVLLVGADLRALPEEWVDRLLRPVWDGSLDFVAPVFPRHVLDGTLTSCLLYPVTRALYGRAVRHVMTAEAALSAALVTRLCDSPAGTPATRSLSLLLTTTAAAVGLRLGEVGLGPREEEPHETRLDLAELMTQVVGAAFALAELYEEHWREPAPAPAPRRLGEPAAGRAAAPSANPARMVAVFRQGLRDLVPIWEQALSTETLADLYPLGDLGPEEFVFSADLWARVVYDFLLAYRFRVLHRQHLLQSLAPLYLGRVAAWVREVAGEPRGAAQERVVQRQVRAFEERRADFVDRWR